MAFKAMPQNLRVVYQRPTGRLMRPSDHAINGHGLGELDGFLDVLKNFGSGVVKFVSAGIYDPNKNRFYVPFSSGQMRNWAQGATNTYTLGLVKTDKFFNSQTAKTIGTIAGGIAAAGAAYAGGKLISGSFSSSSAPVQGPTMASGAFYSGGQSAVSNVVSTGGSLFSKVESGLKLLDTGTKLIGAVAGGMAKAPTQQQQQPMGMMVPMPVAMPMPIDPMTGQPVGYYPGQGGQPMFDPGMFIPGGGGGGAPQGYSGGGGGFGPPGSEFASMDQNVMQMEEGMSTGMKIGIALSVGAVVYLIMKK